MSDIHGFPAAQTAQLWEKIHYLVEDPLPDGKLKKKIKDKKDIYRLRVGDFRVFYTFGDTWVRLLGIRRRQERTYSDGLADMQADQPQAGVETVDIDVDTLDVEEAPRPAFRLTASVTSTPLPRCITAEWLHDLQIPAACIPILVSCESEEALLGATVPATILGRVLDNLFPLPLAEVEQQPDLVVRDANDLVRYKEGDLVSFLLKLDADQQHLTHWALKGPTMVKGGAGTGKSTVALYRARALLEAITARGDERLLFTTYTRALIAASQQLLGQLLTPEQLEQVRVASCDEMAREIVACSRRIGRMETSGLALQVLRTVRQRFQPSGPSAFDRRLRAKALQALSDRYLLEEFDWIIDGRGLVALPQYIKTLRPGRGCALRPGLREAVWELHGAFKQEMVGQGFERWPDLRSEALRLVQEGHWSQRFDYVIVDEAQDLTPTSLCLMAELARSPDGLFFAADSKQSLYTRNYTWTSAHPRLQFQGRTRMLTRNYRSTAEIDRAAFDVLMPEADEVMEPSTSIHSGPLPVLVTGVPLAEESAWAARFVRQMARHLRMKLSTSAVLVPSQTIGHRVADELSGHGMPARFFPGRELDLHAEVVKVLTLHSAKGLEFPIVVLCGFEPGTYPESGDFEDAEVYLERMRHARRLLYVGMSRAMRGLMVLRNDVCAHQALHDLQADHWHVEVVE
jgi:mRNA-degrading endonuclease RelE of RelBE toxin-antitoxin system